MRTIYIWLTLLLLGCVSGFGQTPEETYLQLENARIANANKTELDIDNFITNNLSSYNLTQARLNQVTNPPTEIGTEILTGQALQDAILVAKKAELRKLYFQQNPSSLNNYTANSSMQQNNCVNGNFETGTTAGYTFRTRQEWNHTECTAVITGFNALTPSTTLNNYGAYASLVTPGPDTFLATKGININKVPTNGGGGFALRINKSQNNSIEEETVLSRTFIADQPVFSLNFALALENPAHAGNENPFVRFRITDTTNGVFVERCISSTDNTGLLSNGSDSWRFMNWTCLDLNINQFVGHNVVLEIVIADCHFSEHDAILYLDNICNNGSPCSGNTVGSLQLNPFNVNCPKTPFTICGSFTPPSAATGGPNLTLQIIPTSGTPITLNNAVITNNNYCFTVNPSLFGNNPQASYEISVNASFNNGTIQFSSNNSNVSGADISFNNCLNASITLNSVNENCPLFPLNVTGFYTAPAGATITGLILQVINSANTVVGTVNSPVVSGTNFSFTVNENHFGPASPITGNFEFKVIGLITSGGSSISVSDLSANDNPDVSFSDCSLCCANCCVDNQSLASPVLANYVDTRQANMRIHAVNTIHNGAFASYHAGDYVLLKPGFNAVTGSRVHVYNEGCTGQYLLRGQDESPSKEIAEPETIQPGIATMPEKVELVRIENQDFISIHPNPNNGIFKITLSNIDKGIIEVTDLLGIPVYKKSFEKIDEFEVDIQNKPRGIYIVRVIAENRMITEKIIKK